MDPAKINDLKDLENLLELMKRHGLSEVELEGEGRKIRLKKPEPNTTSAQPLAPAHAAGALPGVHGSLASPPPAEPPAAAAPAALPANVKEVTSPMVGTFYRAGSPEADPFVKEGDRVEDRTVLCIIEAMKVMNEIQAGMTGIVTEILVKNGESVEFGQPLLRIQTE